MSISSSINSYLNRQIQELREQKVTVYDEKFCRDCLTHIGHSRIIEYLSPVTTELICQENFGFESIVHLYRFDEKLRLLVFQALGYVESSIRSQLSFHVTLEHGSKAHCDSGLWNSRHYKGNYSNFTSYE
jgi:abortive infection bacteriophage resistance protein